jgi:two-component system, cell cycle sensor histidine kinase and response regulator CckA
MEPRLNAPKTIRVLMVDDDRQDFELVERLLSGFKDPGYAVDWTPSFKGGVEAVRKGGHDLYLVDYLLGPHSGLDFLRDAALIPCPVPILLLAGLGSPELNREAIARGAADYLHKGSLTADQLQRSIRYALERGKIMAELRQNGEMFRALIENALDGVCILEKDGTTSYLSPSIEPMLGYTPQERKGKNAFELIHPEDAPVVAQAMKDLFEAPGRVRHTEFRFKHKDGSWRFLEGSAGSHDFTAPSLQGIVVHYRDITEKKAAEEILKRSEGNLKAIFNNSAQSIALMDQEGRLVAFNAKASDSSILLGGAAYELGQKVIDYAPSTHRDIIQGRIQKALAGETLRFESQYKDAAGTEHWYEVTYNPVLGEAGKVVGFCLMSAPIDERKKVDRALRESEERFRSVFESSPTGIGLVGLDSKMLVVNPRFCAIVGYPAAELIGKSFIDITYSPDIEADVQNYQHLVAGQIDSYEMEKRFLRKDGRIVWVNLVATLVRNEAGEPLHGLGLVEDISERKKNEEALSELAAILAQTSAAVSSTDLEGTITVWNRGAEKLFGYKESEILGRSIFMLATPDLIEEMRGSWQRVGKGENIADYETTRLKKNGDPVEVAVNLGPIHNAQGKVTGISVIYRDLTKERGAQEALKKQEEQMRSAQKMDAIGRLAGGVAHDFNNLLSVIGGNAEFLMMDLSADSPQREELMEIQKAVKRGADLTRQLLVFGQKQVSQPAPLQLNEIVAEMHKMLRRLIDAQIEIVIEPEPGLWMIVADPIQIQQVILNLALNARDAMPHGGRLVLRTRNVGSSDPDLAKHPELQAGGYVKLWVTDTGVGMTPAVQKRVFEPFFTTKADKGTGLGLSTVYGIVHQAHGHISLESHPNLGTTFTIFFPAETSGKPRHPSAEPMALLPVGTETVLVAEDEEPVRKIVVRILEKQGYRVLEADQGESALKTAQGTTEPIHLLLTDTVMPKMNGKELAQKLKKSRPKMKVLFMSGYPQEVLARQGTLEPGIHLLQKPFTAEELAQKIRRVLDGR